MMKATSMHLIPTFGWVAVSSVLPLAAASPGFYDGVLMANYRALPGLEFEPNVVATGVAASALGLGSSYADLEAGVVLPGTVFFNPTIASPTAFDALLNEQYFEFTLSSLDGRLFRPTEVSFDTGKGGGSVRGWALLSSADGFTAPLAESEVISVQPELQGFTVAIESLPLGSDPITFRLYGYSQAEGQGLFFDEIAVIGSVQQIASMVRAMIQAEQLLASGGQVVQGGRMLHREIERETFGRTITDDRDYHTWGNVGVDWWGGGSGETFRGSGGFAYKLPRGLIGQVIGSVESTRGGSYDSEAARFGFAFDSGADEGMQWLGYLGGVVANFDSVGAVGLTPGSAPLGLDSNGHGIQVLGAFGWWFRHGPVTWGPSAALEYLSLNVAGGSVIGAPLPASASIKRLDSARTLLGVRVRTEPLAFGLQPFASLDLATEWSSEDRGSFYSVFGSSPVSASEGRGTSVVLSCGLSVPIQNWATGSVVYIGEVPLSGGGIESHGFRIGIGGTF